MANHQSALKRIRQIAKRREHNRYHGKTMRSAIRDFRGMTNKAEAEKKLPEIVAMIDKNAKRNIIHKNKAGNIKSKLTRLVNNMK